MRLRRWRRGDGEGARERAGGRASTYTAIVDGRTDGRGRTPSVEIQSRERQGQTEKNAEGEEESIVLKERRAIEEAKPSTRTNTK